MIYFDNAATTLPKPPGVERAVCEALHTMGNAGRGTYQASLSASRSLYDVREQLADFFQAEQPQRIAFTMNATEALNMAVKGIVGPESHIVTTSADHNSVLRPCYEMAERGCTLTIIDCDEQGRLLWEQLEEAMDGGAAALVVTHASNVTGNVFDIQRMSALAHQHDCLFVLDASQTAGILDLRVQDMGIDVLCFTGHKALMGPQGTGGIYVRPELEVRPLVSGGTGVQSYSRTQPVEMPAVLEAGTANGHGVAGLGAGIEFIVKTGITNIRSVEERLAHRFLNGLRQIDGVRLYGDFAGERVGVVSLNLYDYDSALVSDALFTEYGIATRAGAHCAPLMHEALGTTRTGTVRFSFSYFNTEAEVDQALEALGQLAAGAERDRS